MKNFKPLGNVVVIIPEDDNLVTAGGIIKINPENKEVYTATVVSVGTGAYDSKGKHLTAGVAVGDRIVYNLPFRKTYRVGNKDLVLLRCEGIVAKLK